jgi:hypothetical protein
MSVKTIIQRGMPSALFFAMIFALAVAWTDQPLSRLAWIFIPVPVIFVGVIVDEAIKVAELDQARKEIRLLLKKKEQRK